MFKKIKKKLKQAKTRHQREREAEHIYKKERELAYAQAERREALRLAEQGKKPKKKAGFDIGGFIEMLGGSSSGKQSDPLELFSEPKKRKKKRKSKRRKKR